MILSTKIQHIYNNNDKRTEQVELFVESYSIYTTSTNIHSNYTEVLIV